MKPNGERRARKPAQDNSSTTRSWARGLVRYDAEQRRVWLADQRVHHGLTGALIAAAGLAGLASKRMNLTSTLQFAMLGSALMADDWHDRAVWLTREHAPSS